MYTGEVNVSCDNCNDGYSNQLLKCDLENKDKCLINRNTDRIDSDDGYMSKEKSQDLSEQFSERLTIKSNVSGNEFRDPRHLQARNQLNFRIYSPDEDCDNLLMLSIIHEKPKEAAFMILCAVSHEQLNVKNTSGYTALMYAVACKQYGTIRLLMCYGASLTIIDKTGDTALHIACRLGIVNSVRELTRPFHASERLPIRYDIPNQRIPQDLNLVNYEGETCLHLAAKYFLKTEDQCALDIISILESYGADINAKERKSGKTILHMATENDCVRLVNHIISMRLVNFDEETYTRRTAVDIAHLSHYSDIEDKLVRVGARPFIENSDDSDDMWDEGYCESPS